MSVHSRVDSRCVPAFLLPRPFVSMVLSVACCLSPVFDSAAFGKATPAPADKSSKLDPALKGLPISDLTADEAITHALNRLAYGARPGDIDRIKKMGLAKWIDQQLNPGSIEDHAVEARLDRYPTLRMSSAALIADYPRPKQAANNKQEVRREQAERRAEAAEMKEKEEQGSGAAAEGASASRESADAPAAMKQDPSMEGGANRASRGLSQRDALNGNDPNAVPRNIADGSKRPQRVIEELAMAKVTRAAYSDRQLQQVMDDFWFNHFNVFAGKGEDRYYLTSYERDVIQPHALGKFKDLLTATAKSPAMLFYLDNFLSADPRAAQRMAQERAMRQGMRRRPFPPPNAQNNKKQERGLNENYGRELMELHTLGVDGGYTQKDVTEVARCFTGWTIERPREHPQFKFDDRLHDPDPKFVLGKKIHSGGMKDGEEVIDLLVRHASTAKFISTKLARRFVSDAPPDSLVQRMAQSFQSSGGDIRAVLHTMIYSPEF
jgi:uncharacterized protein (DUF1800 family)